MEVERLSNNIVTWIKEIVTTASCQGVIFGMSGGVDSSVLAVLCSRALPESCLGLIMPCYSDEEDRLHAEMVAEKFEIPTKTITLDGVYDYFLTILPENTNNAARGKLARSNIKPRLRMTVLYYFANQMKYLVIGSSNRCELYVGYFSKHGDGAVDALPLGNLVKSQVRQLASYLGVPDEIVKKPPSAGLWRGQTDEYEMGITYDQLDRYLLTGEGTSKMKEKIETMVKMNYHKSCLPYIPPTFHT